MVAMTPMIISTLMTSVALLASRAASMRLTRVTRRSGRGRSGGGRLLHTPGGLLRTLGGLLRTLVARRRRARSRLRRTLARLHRWDHLRPLECWSESGVGWLLRTLGRLRPLRRLGAALRGGRRLDGHGPRLLSSTLLLRHLFPLASLTLLFLTGSLLGKPSRLFLLRLLPRRLLFNTTVVIGLDSLALAPLGFDTIFLALYGLVGLATLLIDLVLLLARFLLEYVAIDIGSLRADLDVHRALP